jgi:hypothetical protein
MKPVLRLGLRGARDHRARRAYAETSRPVMALVAKLAPERPALFVARLLVDPEARREGGGRNLLEQARRAAVESRHGPMLDALQRARSGEPAGGRPAAASHVGPPGPARDHPAPAVSTPLRPSGGGCVSGVAELGVGPGDHGHGRAPALCSVADGPGVALGATVANDAGADHLGGRGPRTRPGERRRAARGGTGGRLPHAASGGRRRTTAGTTAMGRCPRPGEQTAVARKRWRRRWR